MPSVKTEAHAIDSKGRTCRGMGWIFHNWRTWASHPDAADDPEELSFCYH